MDEETRRVLPKTGYPRRRAVAACLTCRERKRKCDNLRPACSSCQQIGIPCEYVKQDASTFDAATLTVLDRLSVIEGLVRDMHSSSSHFPSGLETFINGMPQGSLRLSEGKDPATSSPDLDASLRTATDRLLMWPVFQKLLSPLQRYDFVDYQGFEAYTYLSDLLTQNGASDSSWSTQSSFNSSTFDLSTERSDIEPLVDRFFRRVNNKNPILDRRTMARYCQQCYEHGPLFTLESCLVFLACALGAISMGFNPSEIEQSSNTSNHPSSRLKSLRLSHAYFIAAEKRLGKALSTVNSLAIQCLCLAGIYQMYLIRPMHALRMFHAAGSSLQVLASTGLSSKEEESRLYSNLFWTYYKSEREILAEIPICAPALRAPGRLDSYPSPPEAASTASDAWTAQEEDSWYFLLSEIALRRITDQVADAVSKYIDVKHQSHRSAKTEELMFIVEEFERQAEEFRERLPLSMKFPDVPEIARTEWQQYSRGRYYRVLELMHRPFLFTALHEPNCSQAIRALAEKALLNAFRYLQHSVIGHRHHGLWLQLRNTLRAASLLLIASRSPMLNMPPEWETGIAKAAATFEYWSPEFPSCKSYTGVMMALTDSPLRNATEGDTSMMHD